MTEAPAGARRYWFRRKRTGIGWGLPGAWQGWAILVTYCVVFIGSALLDVGLFDVISVPLTLALIVVIFLTGDPDGRRWNRS